MRKIHFKLFWCLVASIVRVHRQVSACKHENESAPTLLQAQTQTCLHPAFKLKPTRWLTCKHSYILWKYIHLNVCHLKREIRHEAAILHRNIFQEFAEASDLGFSFMQKSSCQLGPCCSKLSV